MVDLRSELVIINVIQWHLFIIRSHYHFILFSFDQFYVMQSCQLMPPLSKSTGWDSKLCHFVSIMLGPKAMSFTSSIYNI